MKKRVLKILLLSMMSTILLLQSCIKRGEDEGCLPSSQIVLQLSYTLNVENVEKAAKELTTLDILFYGEEDDFLGRDHIDIQSYPSGLLYHVPNEYKEVKSAVVWGNLDLDYYTINDPHTTPKDGVEVSAKCKNGISHHPTPSLFHGAVDNIMPNQANIVRLTKNTSTIVVEMLGADLSNPGYAISITGDNGRYRCDNGVVRGTPIAYLPKYEVSAPTRADWVLTALHTVLRIFPDGTLRLKVDNLETGEEVFDKCLNTMLESAGYMTDPSDWDRYDHHVVKLTFNEGRVSKIEIGDWIWIEKIEEL